MPGPGRPPKPRVKEITLPEPMPHQLPLLLSPARYKVACCGRRWGKTVAGLLSVIEGHGPRNGGLKGALEGGNVWWVAPSYGVASKIWRALKDALAVDERWIEKREVERRIDLPGGGCIEVHSADNPDSLRGDGLDGVVVDEAAFCAEETWTQALRPALSDKRGWAIFISTPKGQNWFWELFEQAGSEPGYGRWQLPTSQNPLIAPEEIEQARRTLGTFAFRQEYLAEFVTPGGGLIRGDWLKRFERRGGMYILDGGRPFSERDCVRFCTVDLAASLKETADYTVCATWGVTFDADLLLLDVVRKRFEGPDHLPLLKRVLQQWQPSFFGIERQFAGLALVQAARREGIPVREMTADKDKVSRSLPAAALAEAGKVYIPATAPWLTDFLAELEAFPEGEHDDQVDCFSYAAALLKGGTIPKRPEPPPLVIGGHYTETELRMLKAEGRVKGSVLRRLRDKLLIDGK